MNAAPIMSTLLQPRSKVIYVCNPNNPTGTCVSKEEVAYLMERVPDEVLVVFDQAYYEYAQRPEYADGMEYLRLGRENVIVLRTFSKVYGMAGLRLGYGIAHPSIVACLREAGERFPVNQAAQLAGMAVLQDYEWLRKTVALVRAERAWVATQLEEMGLETVPSQANFVLIRLGPQCQRVIEALLCLGIIVRPGAGFGMPEWLRLTIGKHEENQCFIDALKHVLEI
jgi:histidinol-phosphate aminotransferase